jgi:hypothetical protein
MAKKSESGLNEVRRSLLFGEAIMVMDDTIMAPEELERAVQFKGERKRDV